jgi:putative intracellular protease/amidase
VSVIGIALFDGAEELDWAGPWEVLAAWAKQWPDDGVRVFTLARESAPITCAKLPTLGRDIDVRPGDRFVDNGNVITAAGVSAGIDMALHLVARLRSPERAREVCRYIQYDSGPPV